MFRRKPVWLFHILSLIEDLSTPEQCYTGNADQVS
jgi:hypothetical protein